MNGGWKVWTRKESGKNSPPRKSDSLDYLFPLCYDFFDLARCYWIFWFYDALSDG